MVPLIQQPVKLDYMLPYATTSRLIPWYISIFVSCRLKFKVGMNATIKMFQIKQHCFSTIPVALQVKSSESTPKYPYPITIYLFQSVLNWWTVEKSKLNQTAKWILDKVFKLCWQQGQEQHEPKFITALNCRLSLASLVGA